MKKSKTKSPKKWIVLKRAGKGKNVTWEPVEVTPKSFSAMLSDMDEYSTYSDKDERFEVENARIYFDEDGKYFKGYWIVDTLGIIAPHAVFAYDENVDAADHFIEITEKLHKANSVPDSLP
jgi:hypothetical protein